MERGLHHAAGENLRQSLRLIGREISLLVHVQEFFHLQYRRSQLFSKSCGRKLLYVCFHSKDGQHIMLFDVPGRVRMPDVGCHSRNGSVTSKPRVPLNPRSCVTNTFHDRGFVLTIHDCTRQSASYSDLLVPESAYIIYVKDETTGPHKDTLNLTRKMSHAVPLLRQSPQRHQFGLCASCSMHCTALLLAFASILGDELSYVSLCMNTPSSSSSIPHMSTTCAKHSTRKLHKVTAQIWHR